VPAGTSCTRPLHTDCSSTKGSTPVPVTATARADGGWAVPWIDGSSVWEVFAPARDGHTTTDQRTTMRQTARTALAALERLHEAGWIHGDMQAENAILAGDVI
jgi:tRNA A-37 threonylcarbamoyl transferase component Bud32